jgi:hypothetical protein
VGREIGKESFKMKKILGLVGVALAVACLSAASLFAQTVVEVTSNYYMTEDVEGDGKTDDQYFCIDNSSDILFEGNMHSVSMKGPYTKDGFGFKVRGPYAARDTVRRVRFIHCNSGLFARGWAMGPDGERMGGLIDSCYFIENRSGMFTGSLPSGYIEIRDCLFQANNNGASLRATDSMWVHHNVFFADTSSGIILRGHEDYGPFPRGNLIEHNVFTGHGDYGIEVMDGPVGNTIRNNRFINDPISVVNADSNLFVSNFITDCDTAIRVSDCIGNVFQRDTVANTTVHIKLNSAAKVTFIGTIFDSAKVAFGDAESELTVKWYLDVTVTGSGPIEGAIVKIYDKDQTLVVQDTTDADGKISTQDLTAYVRSSISVTSYNPYSVVTSVEGYQVETTSVYLTENTSLDVMLTVVKEIERMGIPDQFALEQNYPNPFNPQTSISYQLRKSCQVSLRVYDLSGRLVTTLVDGFESAGHKSVEWDARDNQGNGIASGIYFYSLVAGDFKETKRMVLMR